MSRLSYPQFIYNLSSLFSLILRFQADPQFLGWISRRPDEQQFSAFIIEEIGRIDSDEPAIPKLLLQAFRIDGFSPLLQAGSPG
jgi:hypothetical protein